MTFNLPKKSLSLRHKITGSFLILIFFSSLVIGFYSYYNMKSNIESVVGNTALSTIQAVKDTIDADKFSSLQAEADMKSEYYKHLQTRLMDIRKTVGLKYLYTMRKTEANKYIYVVDGTEMNDKQFSSLGNEETSITRAMMRSFNGISEYEFSSDKWGNLISTYIPIKDQSGKVIGIVGADFDANNMVNQLHKFRRNIGVIIVVVIIMGILISEVLSIILVRSLNKLKRQAELIKEGDLTVKFDNITNDEIGVLTKSFKDMVDNLSVITNRIKTNTKEVVLQIDSVNNDFSESSKSTEQIAEVITEIAAGALEQTQSVDEVVKSMNQVFEQVKKSVEHATLVSDSSNQAVIDTAQAIEIFKTSIEKVISVNKTIEHTDRIIQELGNKSKEIGSFSDTISQITKQTNLLSLNAEIEAARAGEHGKGFAVVANEVKVLAEQSNDATRQISDIAASMQKEISDAIKTIRDGVIKAKEGVDAVTKVDEYLLNLQKSSDEAYLRVKDIIKSIESIENDCNDTVNRMCKLADISKYFSEGSQHVAASTEEQSAIMYQINENLDNIKQVTYKLNSVVDKFKVD
ncbi:methyl-accepting chemotaxis protein [Clostridium oryzae]|uniref:Methyl-accepting chemotaxis protein McpB n=1 Tax=Clostridium oryzae TaxID=1450648 RepID=A0A1V4IWN8_9CLOT|nr:methyl-accepting chemotaxis protein [Clostridium oryzae]OPJ64468.1 methyl-accepting chemotaxis protein McpB [Clostridium oryzae]